MALGKRKRDADESVDTGGKRRKILKPSLSKKDHQIINPYVSIPVPTPISRHLSLFSLPAELRNQIWQYVYGNLTVYVYLNFFTKSAEASHTDLTYKIWTRLPKFLSRVPLRLPPRVSKQFHSEATSVFYATSTFSIGEPHTFRTFALSQHPCVPRIRNLKVSHLTSSWQEVLVSSLVGRFKSLRGVRMVHRYWFLHAARPSPRVGDSEYKAFWRMVRAFQQHELEPSVTRFEVVVHNAAGKPGPYVSLWEADNIVLGLDEPHYDYLLQLQADLTRGLMTFTPRRLSTRCTRSR